MKRVHTDAILGGWKLKEFAGKGRVLMRIGKPISCAWRGEDDGCDDVTATPRLFLPLKLNYVRPSID